MQIDDNVHGEGKTTTVIGNKTFLRINRSLLLSINIYHLICNTANYYNAYAASSNTVLNRNHILYVNYTSLTLETDRYDSTASGSGFTYTVFIASFA